MCGCCGCLLMVLRGPTNVHWVQTALHWWADFSSQTGTVHPSGLPWSLFSVCFSKKVLQLQSPMRGTASTLLTCKLLSSLPLPQSPVLQVEIQLRLFPGFRDSCRWRIEEESTHCPGFIGKHGVMGCMQVYRAVSKAALMHAVSTMKCISLD